MPEAEDDKFEVDEDLKLLIPLKSYRKLLAYVDLVDDEVSGFADVKFDQEKKAFVVGEIYLMEQEVSGASTDIEEEDVSDFILQMAKKGKRQLPRLWWHSHANMGTFWSGTDEDTIEKLKNNSFTIALETNHDHEFICSIMLWKPFKLRINNVPVKVIFDYERIPQYLKAEVKKKVKKGGWWAKQEEKKEKKKKKQSRFSWTPKKVKLGTLNSPVKEVAGAIPGAKYLPRKRSRALARIRENNLSRIWLSAYEIWVYKDYTNDDIWLDVHGAIEEDFGVFND